MKNFLGSFYLKLIFLGILAFLPAGFLILRSDNVRLNRLLDQQLKEQISQVGLQVHSTLPLPEDKTLRFPQAAQRILEDFNKAGLSSRLSQAALYKRSPEQPAAYQMVHNVTMEKQPYVPLLSTEVFKPADFSKLRKVSSNQFTLFYPVESFKSPDFVLFIASIDNGRQAYIHDVMVQHGLYLGISFLLILVLFGFVIQSDILFPLKYLKKALSDARKSALDPDDFGVLSELVRLVEDVRHARQDVDEPFEQYLDSDTGLGTDMTAKKMFETVRKSREESYIVFFKVNFAKEYIKVFGRANRSVIKKNAATALKEALPAAQPLSFTEDFFFVTILKPKEFRTVLPRAQRVFNESVLRLYELGQGKQVSIQTLSAFAISSLARDVETYEEALDLVMNQWQTRIDRRKGGWAILDAGGQIEQSDVPEPAEVEGQMVDERTGGRADLARPPVVQAGERTETGDSDLDPVLERKMFIVKLSRLVGVKPRLAAQVYSAGWRRPDLLLQSKIQEVSSKSGIEPQEASDLIGNLRKVPKEQLAYSREDFKDVFVTDVRMIRKIPRETLSLWFDAGFRRVEDLRGASADDLAKLDANVEKHDIEAVLSSVRGGAG